MNEKGLKHDNNRNDKYEKRQRKEEREDHKPHIVASCAGRWKTSRRKEA